MPENNNDDDDNDKNKIDDDDDDNPVVDVNNNSINDSNNDNNDEEITMSIEKVFDFIKEGKEDQSIEDYWTAATKFVQAQDMLMKLATKLHRSTTTSSINQEKEEQKQIIKLYKQQAREYLFQSRQCLIEAMSQERSDDEDLDIDFDSLQEQQHQQLEGLHCLSLSDEQAQIRNKTFAMLFSKYYENRIISDDPPPLPSIESNNDINSSNVEEQQSSLEERLQNLNANLPPDLKTSKERMDDINKGLNRLGLSLYPQKKPFERFQDEIQQLPKDEDEQINDIMAQVQDEVAIEKQFGTTSQVLGTNKKTTDDDDDDYSSDDDDSQDEDEEGKDALLLDDEQLAMKIIRSKVVKAQTKLAELVAYLDEAKIAKAKEDDDEEHLLDNNNDDDDSIEKPDYTTYLTSGKKKLKNAQRDLKKAMMEWTENLS